MAISPRSKGAGGGHATFVEGGGSDYWHPPIGAAGRPVCPECRAEEGELHKDTCSKSPPIVKGYVNGCIHCGRSNGMQHMQDCPITETYWATKQGELDMSVIGEIAKQLESKERIPPHEPPLAIVVSIPPEVKQYASEIARFVEAMVFKLSVHSKKGKWENLPIAKALELLRGEEEELTEAVRRGNMVEILLESADTANYALIISAIAMEKK